MAATYVLHLAVTLSRSTRLDIHSPLLCDFLTSSTAKKIANLCRRTSALRGRTSASMYSTYFCPSSQRNESSSLRPSIERQPRSPEFFVFHESMSSSFFIAPYHYRSGTLSCARVGFTWVNAAPGSVINCHQARGAVINSERQKLPSNVAAHFCQFPRYELLNFEYLRAHQSNINVDAAADSRRSVSRRNLPASLIVGGSCRRRIALRGVISGHLIAYQIASETPF